MYCERCSRIVDGDRCPYCRNKMVRDPEAKDPCFLTEQDYVFSSILEDVLKQNGIPFLKKGVMGAGLAIKAGPTLERSRFYVPFDRFEAAAAVLEELFSAPPDEAGPDMPEDPSGERDEEQES